VRREADLASETATHLVFDLLRIEFSLYIFLLTGLADLNNLQRPDTQA
jgi:hypothetical protein